ncbi:MAG: type II toxin-antitoxin system VapB family antitoxin [bacterium]|nr:type II toxin-antitoxin system VapB family antitoxin [bacterium]
MRRITEDALREHISKIKKYQKLLKLEGKIEWEGNLDELRMART